MGTFFTRILILISLGSPCLAFAYTGGIGQPTVDLEFIGASQTVTRWQKDRCEDIDIPDTALRAFRRADGKVVAVASHYVTYTLVGSDLYGLKKDGCLVSYRSPKDPDPSHYDDQTWLAATWTDDGMSVAGVGHHEYHGELHPGRCAGKTPRECRYGVLSLFSSKDGGRSFGHANLRPIAAVSVTQQFDQGKDIGFFQPSNIMEWEGHKYMFVRTSGGGRQAPSACLMRATNPLKPDSWEIYDGKGYRQSLFDPYKDDPTKGPVCGQIPGLNGMVWGLLRHRSRDVFIALLAVNQPGTKTLRLAISASKSLLSWPRPKVVEGIAFEWSGECSAGPVYHYPSLIDPDAPGRNFDTTDDDALLFLTAINRRDCKMSLDRDLIYRRVHLRF